MILTTRPVPRTPDLDQKHELDLTFSSPDRSFSLRILDWDEGGWIMKSDWVYNVLIKSYFYEPYLGMLVPKALARERRLTYLNGLDDIKYIWKLKYEKILEKIFATWGRSFSYFFH